MYDQIEPKIIPLSVTGIMPEAKKYTEDDVIINPRPSKSDLKCAEDSHRIILTALHYPDSVIHVVKENNLSVTESRRLLRAWLKGYLEGLGIGDSSYMIVYMVTKDISLPEWAIEFNTIPTTNRIFQTVTNVY